MFGACTLQVEGNMTLGENIADFGGMKVCDRIPWTCASLHVSVRMSMSMCLGACACAESHAMSTCLAVLCVSSSVASTNLKAVTPCV